MKIPINNNLGGETHLGGLKKNLNKFINFFLFKEMPLKNRKVIA